MRFFPQIARIVKIRSLTRGEVQLAQTIFGQAIDLQKTSICASRWIWRGYAMSPNGHIYFHSEDWCDDFSLENLSAQSWLIHELVHVWQVQQGMAVFRRALLDRRYHYQLWQDKPFLAYGVEQQAQMVQDYFVRRARGQDCTAWERCLPFINSP